MYQNMVAVCFLLLPHLVQNSFFLFLVIYLFSDWAVVALKCETSSYLLGCF